MAVISDDLRGVGAALALLAPHVSHEYQALVTLTRLRLQSLAVQVERLEGGDGLPQRDNGGAAPVAPVSAAPIFAAIQAVFMYNAALCSMGERQHGPLQ